MVETRSPTEMGPEDGGPERAPTAGERSDPRSPARPRLTDRWGYCHQMGREIEKVLIGRDLIAARIAEMGRRISEDLAAELAARRGPGRTEERIVLVPILTGAIVFVADLIRHMTVKMSVSVVTASSYPGAAVESQGAKIRGDLPTDLKGAHVLVVDDILDSGRTLGLLRRVIAAQEPASLRIAVLLRKRKAAGRSEEVAVEYAGFDIEDEFVVGYGLDYDGYFRNLPDIAVLGVPPQGSRDAGGSAGGGAP